MVENGLELADNISHRWLFSDFDTKRKLQELLFPDGILYTKQIDEVRTLRTNTLFPYIPLLVKVLE